MLYRQLGRTGLTVSQLGFGAMRLPMKGEGEEKRVDRGLAIPMIHRAFEAGVNYIDTAVGYCNKDSQRAVGDALKGWRERVIVSTKNQFYDKTEKEWRQNLEDSLERLQVQYIDIYNHHGLRWARYVEHVEGRIAKWMARAKDEGLIRHIGFSFHDSNEALVKLVDTGYGEVVTLQYNLLDRQLEEGIAYAREKGMGIVVMGPVGGGRLGDDSEVLSSVHPEIRRIPELAMRFVLANPNVSTALSGMSTMQQVEENLAAACNPAALSESDMAIVSEQLDRLKKMADLYCTGCRYCMPCESKVDIPRVFGIYALDRVYALGVEARKRYAGMLKAPEHKKADATLCTECGACEPKCPQNISIRRQLKQAHEVLAAACAGQ